MPAKLENVRISKLRSIVLMLILTSGLLLWFNTGGNPTMENRHSSSVETSLSKSGATVCQSFRLEDFKLTWIYNSNTFTPVSIYKYQFQESKKTDLQISILQDILNNTVMIPSLLRLNHLFPPERDEFTPLS